MILAYAKALLPENRCRLRVTAIDISKTACDMCFINTILWGIPERGRTSFVTFDFMHGWQTEKRFGLIGCVGELF
jgi:methylase of polypeptide subunit release factors